MKFNTNELRSLTILENLPEKLYTWLSDQGTRIELAAQEHLFTHDHPANFMFIVVSGKIQRYQEIDGQTLIAATTYSGQVTGMLPFSRMTHYPGNAVAAEPSLSLRIDKRDFDDMLRMSHEFGQRLVGEMSNRVRGDVRLEQQREKMVSLGRLSAGLAHELNNPAAAISSTATSLRERLADQRTIIRTMFRHNLNETAINGIKQLLSCIGEKDFPNISPLQRGEREEEFTDWLEDKGIEGSWEIANILTVAGLQISELDLFAESVPKTSLGDALTWVAGNIEVDRMASEIKLSAGRISELVSSVKTYSHMDQSAEHKSTNLQEGLENTLKMFGHKLKQKKIGIKREFSEDIPAIHGNAGELNQVWTHLIDNAVDAMTEGGNLCIEISRSDWGIDVKIIDDGAGIPEDIRHRIFDPFFTTKGVGEGTGLGLDIARRIVLTHQGQFDVHSIPGKTEMIVRLPIVPEKTKN